MDGEPASPTPPHVTPDMLPGFREVFDAAPRPMLLIRADGRWTMVAVNQAHAAAFGTTPAALCGWGVLEVFPKDPEPLVAAFVDSIRVSLEQVVATRAPDQMPTRAHAVTGPDGRAQLRFWSATNTPILGADGAVTHILSAIQDVTDREALQEAEARLQRAQEAGGVGVFSVGIDDGVLLPSPALCRLYGMPEAERYPAEAFERLVLPEDQGLVSTAASRRDGQFPDDVQYRIRRPDTGEVRWIARKGEIERDADGRPLRFFGVARDITREKAADAALLAEREQLAQLFEQAPTFMAIVRGPQHVFERVNPGFRRLVGATDLEGRPCGDALPGAARQGYLERLTDVLDSGRTYAETGARYVATLPDGRVEERFVDLVLQPLRGPTGVVGGVFIQGADVTERHRLERRQATHLALIAALQDLTDPNEIAHAAAQVLGRALGVSRAGYGIIDKDAETIAIDRDWNAPGVASIAGVLSFRDYGSYIDDLKRGDTVVVADARQDPRTRAEADALSAIQARAFVNMPLVEQGRFVALLFANHAEPRSWSDDDISLMREVGARVRSATERARAEAARRASEAQFESFGRAVPNHIWACRADGFCDWFNDQAYDYTGVVAGGLDGVDGWRAVIHPEDVGRAAAAWSHSLRTGQVYEAEFRVRRHDGAYRWFLARAVPVRDPAGDIQRWVGTNTDIEDRRQDAASLRRLNETLEQEVAQRTADLMRAEEALRQSQKMEAVGQLTGGLAHDFNNLLTGITGSLELLGRRIAAGRVGEAARYIDMAQDAAQRAAALTHRLLAFSRRQTLDPKAFDADRLVAGMVDLVRRTVGPQVHIDVVPETDVWPILADPNQLENALLNLCINSRDAMPGGGRLTIRTANLALPSPEARALGLDPGDYVALSVEDTGSGMSSEVADKAFDPFFTTKPLGSGTGLGLSMVYGFAGQSGGHVRIESSPGQGAIVTLYLPRHTGPAADVADADLMRPQPRAQAAATILVVDDEATVRTLVGEVVEDLGCDVLQAVDGADGLRILQSDANIDLLVTDVGLPGGMNGRQLADVARVLRPGLRVLFITGYAEAAVVGAGNLEPGMHVMTKPFAVDRLGARLHDLIAEATAPTPDR